MLYTFRTYVKSEQFHYWDRKQVKAALHKYTKGHETEATCDPSPEVKIEKRKKRQTGQQSQHHGIHCGL